MTHGRLDIEGIVSGLALRRVGRATASGPNVQLVDSVASTNDLAWTRADDPEADGLVIFAEHQSQGRGRFGRSWVSPRGASLLASVLLMEPAAARGCQHGLPVPISRRKSRAVPSPPEAPHPRQPTAYKAEPDRGANAKDRREAMAPETELGPQLGSAAAVACCQAIARATGVRVEIKWPNDLVFGGRKLGGILVESRRGGRGPARSGAQPAAAPAAYVVGLGINCLQHRRHFPKELRDRATSLDLIAAGPIDRCALARAVLVELDRWYADVSAWTGQELRQVWLNWAAPLGGRIQLHHAGRLYAGHVIDLDPTASLVVQLEHGGRRLFDAASTTTVDQ